MKRTTISVLLTCVTFAGSAFGLERMDLLPDDSLVKLNIADTSAFVEQLKTSPLAEMIDDPNIMGFLGHPDWMDVFSAYLGDSEEHSEIMKEEIQMLSGEVAMGFNLDESFGLVAAMSAADFKRSLKLDDRMMELSSATSTRTRKKFKGVSLYFDPATVQLMDDPEADEPVEPQGTWQAHFKDNFLYGSSEEWIKKSIIRLRDEPLSPARPEARLNGVVYLEKIMDLLSKEMKEGQVAMMQQGAPAGPDLDKILAALGLRQMKQLSFELQSTDRNIEFNMNLPFTSLSGLLALSRDTSPVEMRVPPFVPANAVSYGETSVNIYSLWKELGEKIVPVLSPDMPGTLSDMSKEVLGFDLGPDLWAHAGTLLYSYSVVDEEMMGDAVALSLKNDNAFSDAFEKALSAPNLAQMASVLDQQEFRGSTIYSYKDPVMDAEAAPSLAISDGFLFFGPDPIVRQAIRSIRRGKPSSFSDSKLLEKARKEMLPGATMCQVTDISRLVEAVLREMTKPGMLQMMQQSLAAEEMPEGLDVDLTKLPAAEEIGEYFGATTASGRVNGTGIKYRLLVDYPEEK